MIEMEQQLPIANKENIPPSNALLHVPSLSNMMKIDVMPRDWDDLDAEDADDPLMVSEYVVDIFQYMRQLEVPTISC